MGKKSKTKKINRELKKEEKKDKGKKVIAKKTVEVLKTINHKKIFGGMLTLIMLSLLVVVGFLLFQKAFRPTPIAKILPESSTIAFLEINTNREHNQFLKTFYLLANHPEYSEDSLKKTIEAKLSLNFEKEIAPWFGRGAGAAFTTSQEAAGSIYKLYFAELKDFAAFEKIFQDSSAYKGYKIYKTAKPLYLTVIDNYVFLSISRSAVRELIDSVKDDAEAIYGFAKYRRIDDNLPLNKAAFFYLDFEKINNKVLSAIPFLSEQGISTELLQPFMGLFSAEGFALVALENNFAIQSFLSLSKDGMDSTDYLGFNKKYNAELSKYIAADVLAFWGGENLEYQIKRMLEVLSGGDENSIKIFDDLVKNYSTRYFGEQIDFEEDVLPLFQNEYALALEKIADKNVYKLILKLEDPALDAIKIQDIANAFAKSGGAFEPKIVERKLKDGTVAQEIMAEPKQIEKMEEKYGNYTIYKLQVADDGWGISYVVIDDIALISNHPDGIKSAIDIIAGKKESLFASQNYTYNIKPVMNSADEVNYFNLETLLPTLLKDKKLPAFLNYATSLSSGKNYFDDGIVTTHYLNIK